MTDDIVTEAISAGDTALIRAILQEVCDLTGMGFAAVARVTSDRWIACQVLDKIEFGMEPGGELEVSTTICDEIRQHRETVLIDHVSEEPTWRTHPTPIMYGFQSYMSLPINCADGSFFGTLCAIDPRPRETSLTLCEKRLRELADQVAHQIDESFVSAAL